MISRNFLLLVLDLLRLSVRLPLPLLSAATETEQAIERRLLLDVVVDERVSILKLLASKDEPLLVHRDAWKRSGKLHVCQG